MSGKCVVRMRFNIDIADEVLGLVLNEKGQFDFDRIIPAPAVWDTEGKNGPRILGWELFRRGAWGNAFCTTVIEPDRKAGRNWAEVSFLTEGYYPGPVMAEISRLFSEYPIAVCYAGETIELNYGGAMYLFGGQSLPAPIFLAEECRGLGYPDGWSVNWRCLVVHDEELDAVFPGDDPFLKAENHSAFYDPFLILPGFPQLINDEPDINEFWLESSL